MKILHTSDWHLGHSLYDYDRTEEQLFMMRQIKEILEKERPDAFLISGDLFNSSAPSAVIQRLFADWLITVHADNPQMQIVVTAGNHDSQSRHEIFRSLWDIVGVHMVGSLDIDNPQSHIIKLPNKGFIIAVPYANERFLPENFYTGLLQLTSQQNNDGLPVVMMAHTTVAGCDYSSHRNASERNVGGIDSVNLGIFGDSYDYLALGHIHHPQNLSPRARYSGTPMAISFDEQFQHSVTIVDIEQQGSMPTQRIVPISELRPLVTLPDGDPIPFDDALAMLKDFPDDTKAYIRLNVHIENFLPPNANAQAHSATDGKECRFCHINIKRDLQRQNKETGMSVSELQQISPLDLARRFTTEKGLSFDEELFREIC